MKKFVSIFLVFTLAFCLVACENNSKSFGKSRSEYSLESTTAKKLETATVTEIEANKFYSTTILAKDDPSTSQTTAETHPTTTLLETTFSTEIGTDSPTLETKVGFSDDDIEKIEAELYKLTNSKRVSENLTSFTTSTALKQASKTRSLEIQTRWSHTRPNGTSFTTCINQSEEQFVEVQEIIVYVSVKYVSIGTPQDIDVISAALFECITSKQTHLNYYLNGNLTKTGISVSYLIDEEKGITTFYLCQFLAK